MGSKTTLGFALVLLVIFASDMGVMKSEARLCESPSHSFKGLCFNDRNCANVCLTEGFTGGKCEGARHRCFCTIIC
ncbi:hypothetical protein PHAVU_002G278600 [Phaseolus vulgaris]|uniref:Knottins-like domain-containing protein n=1 Tax=Phaseolus vulgaris TaxID=3885 RepID=V7CNY7_PHAVU|nr:hypothetical protein PHAVU_002G278600g [Phaseolus vulgaris]ESW31912.1 hypothetical protein PHAVU_002G278600g [Phaseolus vulgaris]